MIQERESAGLRRLTAADLKNYGVVGRDAFRKVKCVHRRHKDGRENHQATGRSEDNGRSQK